MPADHGPEPHQNITAAAFDEGFAHAAGSTAVAEVLRAGLTDLPTWVESYSFVPAAGLEEVAARLEVSPGGLILDLACGLGGPGMFVASHAAARVVGVDWSFVGCGRGLAVARSRSIPATYVNASGAALPLAEDSADAALCIDALRFIPGHGTSELLRVLKPSARLVITAWERDEDDALGEAVPSFARVLQDAGFGIISTEQRPEWLAAQRAVYDTAAARVAAGETNPGVVDLAAEGANVLPLLDRMRRVLVTAEAPPRYQGVAQKQ